MIQAGNNIVMDFPPTHNTASMLSLAIIDVSYVFHVLQVSNDECKAGLRNLAGENPFQTSETSLI